MKPHVRAQTLAALGGNAGPRLLQGVELPAGRVPTPAPGAAGSRPSPAAGRAGRTTGQAAGDDIQGNIVPGFNKDHQHFLFLRFGDVDGGAALAALARARG